jgi:hypothetical protein
MIISAMQANGTYQSELAQLQLTQQAQQRHTFYRQAVEGGMQAVDGPTEVRKKTKGETLFFQEKNN